MAIIPVSLLVIAILGVFVKPRWAPSWAAPVAAAIVVMGLSLFGVDGASLRDVLTAATPLAAPLVFLLCAVPLTAMLDRIGFFAALAALVDAGRRPQLALWCLASAVTTFLNLDAAVVLLTPLYIRIAKRHGLSTTMLAFQPVLLACLASSALPISNLTNLIAGASLNLGAGDFIVHLGPASLAATAIGWLAYRGARRSDEIVEPVHDPVDRTALLRGGPIVAFVALGFTLGDAVGIPAWSIALVAAIVLIIMTRRFRVTDLPFGAAALAVGLGIVATTAAPHLGIGHLLYGGTVSDQLRVIGVAGIGADTINNLPALLVGLPSIGHHPALIWPVLFGVNFFPIFVLHGSLAGLLWRETAGRLGVQVSPWQYTMMGLRVGVPALLAGITVLIATSAGVAWLG
ncbi:MAG: SLC13 family permease [Terriglobales bacterium]